LEASTGPPIKLTAISYEQNPSVQSRKRLPLKMIISEMASRDINTVEIEQAHHSAHSHIDDAPLHTAPIQNRCPGRYFGFLDYIRNLVHEWNSLNICPHSHCSMFIVLLWFGNTSTCWPYFTPGVVCLFASIPLTNLHFLIWACFIV